MYLSKQKLDFNVEVTSCWKSSAWSDKDYESNTVSMAGEILLAGIGGNTEGKVSTSGIIEITRCEFEVISSEAVTSRVYGYISELTIVEDGVQSLIENTYIFAGKINIQ